MDINLLSTISFEAGPDLLTFEDGKTARWLKINSRAMEAGCLKRSFFADDIGHVLIVDEWPTSVDISSLGSVTRDIRGQREELGLLGEPLLAVYERIAVPGEL